MTTRLLLLLTLTTNVTGLVISIMLMVDSVRDLVAVRRHGITNGRLIVAKTTLRTETFRFLSLVSLTVTSSSALSTLWDDGFPTTRSLIVARAFLLAASVFIVCQSASVHFMRRELFGAFRTPVAFDEVG